MEVDPHLVSEVSDVLNWITHYGVEVESGSREFPRELAPLDLFGERRIMDFCDQRRVVQRLGLHYPLLDQLVEGKEI